MFTLLRTSNLQDAYVRQIPVLVVSFAIAEFFYKFGSFSLECLAFLATWTALDALTYSLRRGSNSQR